MSGIFSVETAKTVGTPQDGVWSQVHTFSPEDEEKIKKRGTLLAVLVICGTKEGIEVISFGREIIGRLHEEYYGNLEGSAFERLGLAVEKVCQENEGIQITAASLVKDTLNLAVFGEGKILYKRGEKLGFLLKGGDVSGNFGLHTASGFLEKCDLFLLGSDRFYKTVAEGVVRAAFESGSPIEAVEMIAPIILGRGDMADAAAVMALVKEEEDSEIRSVETNQTEKIPEESVFIPKKDRFAFVKKITTKIKFPSKKDVFVQRESRGGKKKIIVAVIIILTTLLATSLYLGIKNKNKGQVAGDKTFISP